MLSTIIPDWIEIINVSDESIKLSRFQLTDDSSLLPTGGIYPILICRQIQYCLFLLPAKNKYLANEFHADFKLDLMDDPVILWIPGARLLDRINPQCVPPDASLGRIPDGSNEWSILSPNSGSFQQYSGIHLIEFVSDSLWVSHPSGFSVYRLLI